MIDLKGIKKKEQEREADSNLEKQFDSWSLHMRPVEWP